MIFDFFKLAFRNIRSKSKRSWLTVLGITIGIAAVVALISLSVGLNRSINEEFEQIGTDKITIMPGRGSSQGPGSPTFSSAVLTDSDLEAVRGVKGVEKAEGMVGEFAEVEYGGKTKIAQIWGANPALLDSFPQFKMAEGRALRDTDKNKAILGASVSEDIFEDLKVKNSLEIRDKKVRVVGIMESMGNPQDDRSIMLPLDSFRDIFDTGDRLNMLYVDAEDTFDVDKVAENIKDKLEDERGAKDFNVQTLDQIMESIDNVLGMIQGLMIGIAAISLLVGGVGIMNTMYTSVLEKTKQIGVMKAVGARNSHVMAIFLIESGLLGFIGGALGVVLGAILGKLAEYGIGQAMGFGMLEIALTPELIAGALAFSFGVGTLSGTLPARNAARLKPVDALRYE